LILRNPWLFLAYLKTYEAWDRGWKEAQRHAPSILIGALVRAGSPPILVPSQVDFFPLPFLSPNLNFFSKLYVLPAPFPTSPPPHLPPCPLLTYIFKLKVLFPVYLLTYKFKTCYFHPHPSDYLPTYPSTFLPTL
jgi:hypothetical protein